MGDSNPHVILFAERHSFVERTGLVEALPFQADSRGRSDPVLHAELVQNVAALPGPHHTQAAAGRLIDLFKRAVNSADASGAVLQDFDLALQLFS
jgi:hypothetical protein